MKINDTFYAVAFNRKNTDLNLGFKPLQFENDNAVIELYYLTVTEQREAKDAYTGQVADEPGFILKAHDGSMWTYNYPNIDPSGRGIIFKRSEEGINVNDFQKILSADAWEACEFDNLCGTMILERYNINDPKKQSQYKADFIPKIPALSDWLLTQHEKYITLLRQKFFVEVMRVPFTKDFDINHLCRYVFVDKEISPMAVLNSASAFGDSAYWPYFMLRERDFDLAILAYRDIHQKSPENTAQLREPAVLRNVDNLVTGLRNHIQRAVDRLSEMPASMGKTVTPIATKSHRHDVSNTRAAQTFCSMSKPDVLGTVDEIAKKFGISKSEVRRRKQDGTLHELSETSAE
jgi:hypothetical protein